MSRAFLILFILQGMLFMAQSQNVNVPPPPPFARGPGTGSGDGDLEGNDLPVDDYIPILLLTAILIIGYQQSIKRVYSPH